MLRCVRACVLAHSRIYHHDIMGPTHYCSNPLRPKQSFSPPSLHHPETMRVSSPGNADRISPISTCVQPRYLSLNWPDSRRENDQCPDADTRGRHPGLDCRVSPLWSPRVGAVIKPTTSHSCPETDSEVTARLRECLLRVNRSSGSANF